VINDVSAKAAQAVVDELNKGIVNSFTAANGADEWQAGGTAVAAPGSVAEGDKVIEQAVKAFGTVHILINNAGILRTSIPHIASFLLTKDR
jgi:multifunctional beta-oxidation protein